MSPASKKKKKRNHDKIKMDTIYSTFLIKIICILVLY